MTGVLRIISFNNRTELNTETIAVIESSFTEKHAFQRKNVFVGSFALHLCSQRRPISSKLPTRTQPRNLRGPIDTRAALSGMTTPDWQTLVASLHQRNLLTCSFGAANGLIICTFRTSLLYSSIFHAEKFFGDQTIFSPATSFCNCNCRDKLNL